MPLPPAAPSTNGGPDGGAPAAAQAAAALGAGSRARHRLRHGCDMRGSGKHHSPLHSPFQSLHHTCQPLRPLPTAGGDGYIGCAVVARLLAAGHTVHATTWTPSAPGTGTSAAAVWPTAGDKPAALGAVARAMTALPGAAERLRWFTADLAVEGSFDAAMAGCKRAGLGALLVVAGLRLRGCRHLPAAPGGPTDAQHLHPPTPPLSWAGTSSTPRRRCLRCSRCRPRGRRRCSPRCAACAACWPPSTARPAWRRVRLRAGGAGRGWPTPLRRDAAHAGQARLGPELRAPHAHARPPAPLPACPAPAPAPPAPPAVVFTSSQAAVYSADYPADHVFTDEDLNLMAAAPGAAPYHACAPRAASACIDANAREPVGWAGRGTC